jgi:hypothetical protein
MVIQLRHAAIIVVDEIHRCAGGDTLTYKQIAHPYYLNKSRGLAISGTALVAELKGPLHWLRRFEMKDGWKKKGHAYSLIYRLANENASLAELNRHIETTAKKAA